ncbi:MAG: cupin domain-containing protein [Actinomycetes bacterium]
MTAHDTPRFVTATDTDLFADLEDWGPRVGADSGEPVMSGRIMHDADGVQVGVWACTPGGWTITDRPDTETVRILSGRARLTNADGTSAELTAGDVLTLPKGWSGRWDILEPVRKFYIVAK